MLLLQKLYFILFFLLLSTLYSKAQIGKGKVEERSEKSELFTFKSGVQFWNVYTIDQKFYNESLNRYSEGVNNWNSLIRRARLNTKFRVSEQLFIQANFSADQLGKDDNSAIQGGKSNTSKSISILDLFARYQMMKSSDVLVLTVGLQRLLIGRETVVSSLKTSSLEKSISQYYQRKQIVGSGNGRTLGFNVGGRYDYEALPFSLHYNVGLFATPAFYQVRDDQSPLYTARFGFDIGNPESSSYVTSYKTNYFGMRNGVTLSTSYSYQGQTSLFDRASSLGFDFLYNNGYFHMDGEIFFLSRKQGIEELGISHNSRGGYLRAGYSFPIIRKQYLELVIMYTIFSGGTTMEDDETASQLMAFSGTDMVFEIGTNYYLSSQLKLSLFYTINNGDTTAYRTTNNFNRRDALNRDIQRGDQLTFAITINI